MLASLRSAFMARLPQGLSDSADIRLQRTLQHYIQEILRVQGSLNEQEILRESFTSMAHWFRRNTEHLVPDVTGPTVSSIAHVREPSLVQPSLVQPSLVQPSLVQPKDFLQKQEDVVKYRETEYNLVINSKDRDWVNSKGQNRYNFSVQLGGTRPQGVQLQTTLTHQFRNITRIEFVKAVIPVEGLDVIPLQTYEPSGSTPPPLGPDQAFYSALAMPYVQVMMDEIVGNNYGTNDTIDRSLAICQYDAAWRSEVVSTGTLSNRGYTLFFPKFMKAQRVYAPTPLATLQQMSFQILAPENQLLSKSSDAAALKTIIFSKNSDASFNSVYGGDVSGDYLFINTTSWFSLWSFSQIDRVQLAGLVLDVSNNPSLLSPSLDFLRWVQREEGHVVVGMAYTDPSSNVIIDGPNECGYANWIIIRNRFLDPSKNGGACIRDPFGSNENTLATALTTKTLGGAVLNLSRQVQLVMRIITRELDPTSSLRPDNV